MDLRSMNTGIVKSCILAKVFVVGLAATAHADDKLSVSGSASFTTNYEFRGVSSSSNDPAVQPEIDLRSGIFWAYMWGTNTAFGNHIELDYGAGILPKWKNFTFTAGVLAYTYPGKDSSIDYFELETAAVWANGPWSVGIYDYWSPNNSQLGTQSDAVEGNIGYTFPHWKIFNFFSPSISGIIGSQMYEHENIVPSYMYWNAGLTLNFMKNWSADIRYWDTDYSKTGCIRNSAGRDNCNATTVGTIKTTF